MEKWQKALIITVVLGLAAFMTGKAIWPPSPSLPMPTPQQLPFFMLISLIESLAFGLGIAFLFLEMPAIAKFQGKERTMAILSYLSLGWLLVSWWPHDNLHMQVGFELQSLLYLEYGFHLTLIIASVILMYSFYTQWNGIRKGVKI